jgi:isopentenyl-diphosphate delta-isomerase
MNIQEFESRKKDHIRHALDPKNQAQGWTGFEQIHLFHDALPDFDLKEVSLKTSCFGRELATPFYVSGMTAGHADAVSINQTLARACAKRGWAMGVGSQRRQINEDLTSDSIDSWRKIRAEAEGLVLLANLGITQLCETPIPKIQRIIESTSAQALAVHLNPLQEALQPEGTPHFKGALSSKN